MFGAEFRRVEERIHQDKPAIAAVAVRSYDTTVEDLWEAITDPERLARWFLPVEGDLELGGRYQLEGNAGGTITRCEAPRALDVTWELLGGTSWLQLRLEQSGNQARLTLKHIAPRDGIGEEHLRQYGPGAVGVGWDLALHGLARHLLDPETALDPAAVEAWTQSSEGKAFVQASGEAWGKADAKSCENPGRARARAARTIAFYSSE